MDACRGFVMFLMMAEVLHIGRVSTSFPDNAFWKFLDFHTGTHFAARRLRFAVSFGNLPLC